MSTNGITHGNPVRSTGVGSSITAGAAPQANAPPLTAEKGPVPAVPPLDHRTAERVPKPQAGVASGSTLAAMLDSLADDPQAYIMALETKKAQDTRDTAMMARNAVSRSKESAMDRSIAAAESAARWALASSVVQATMSLGGASIGTGGPLANAGVTTQAGAGVEIKWTIPAWLRAGSSGGLPIIAEILKKLEPCQFMEKQAGVDRARADKQTEQDKRVEGDLSSNVQALKDQANRAREAVRRMIDAEHALKMAVIGRV